MKSASLVRLSGHRTLPLRDPRSCQWKSGIARELDQTLSNRLFHFKIYRKKKGPSGFDVRRQPVWLTDYYSSVAKQYQAFLCYLTYRRRNRVEIMFGRFKNWRRVAARCDRCTEVFLSAIALAATVIFWQ